MPDEEKTLEDQISEMMPDKVEVEEDPPKEDPPVEVVEEVVEEVVDEVVEEVEEPVEPKEGEETPGDRVEEEVLEEGEVEGEAEKKVEDDPEESKGEEPVDEIAAFRERVNKIAEAALKQGVKLPDDLFEIDEEEVPVVAAVPAAPAAPEVPVQVVENYKDFKILMDGMNFDGFMDSEDGFTKGMRDILSRHEQMLSQRFMGVVPGIVQNQVKQVVALQQATDKFYSVNGDLEEVKPTVGAVANQIVGKHPDWSIGKVMEESAKATRKLLRMPSPSVMKKGVKKMIKPSFAKPGGSQQRNKPKPKMSKLQREIDELMED